MISSLTWVQLLLACGLSVVMGIAIQHGGTCMVAAVDEVLKEGKASRLSGMLEAALWVLAGLLVARFSWTAAPVLGYQINPWTCVGGALLGIGALINGGCVMGTIGRLGTGHWEFVATPPGYAMGSWLVYGWQPQSLKDARIPETGWPPLYEWLKDFAPIGLFTFGACLILYRCYIEWPRSARSMHVSAWLKIAAQPHNATVWIGLCFLALYLLAPDWSYPNLLDDLARGRREGVWERCLLLLLMFAGAIFAGWLKGIWTGNRPSWIRIVECGIGGVLMGMGSALIPGGNDGLIFLGMPLLWPYAWCAMASMVLTIALLLKLQLVFQK